MPKLPGIRHQDAIRVFEKLRYRIIRQGGHIVMSNGETRLIIPVQIRSILTPWAALPAMRA